MYLRDLTMGGASRHVAPALASQDFRPFQSRAIMHAMNSAYSGQGIDQTIYQTAELMSGDIFAYVKSIDGIHTPAQLYVDPRAILTNTTFLRAYRAAVGEIPPHLSSSGEKDILDGIVDRIARELKPEFFKEIEKKASITMQSMIP